MYDLASDTLETARKAQLRIATAESCTGGLIAAHLTEVAGSSDVFERGFVTYSNQAKIEMLCVPPSSIADHGAVSEQVALEMAAGALANSNADIAVSVTGIAGPGGSDHKPEGRVCFGFAMKNANPWAETIEFGALGREKVRNETVKHALETVMRILRPNL